jgi:hypothetical protein
MSLLRDLYRNGQLRTIDHALATGLEDIHLDLADLSPLGITLPLLAFGRLGDLGLLSIWLLLRLASKRLLQHDNLVALSQGLGICDGGDADLVGRCADLHQALHHGHIAIRL